MRSSFKLVFALAAVAGLSKPAFAQTNASINATATVLTAITVTSSNDLAFGNIAPTQTKVVAAAAGGRFALNGAASTPVTISFVSVPTSLGVGLALGSWDGLHGDANNSGTAAAFVPATGTNLGVTLGGAGDYYLWLGATLTAAGAAPGGYTAPISIQVFYN